jgi:hypothetical protein
VFQTAKLQNKKKSISAFMSAVPTILKKGIATNGGIVLELDGDVLVSAPSDIMSRPDKTGRRWIESVDISAVSGKLSTKVSEDGAKVLQKLIVKYGGKKVSSKDAITAWSNMDPRKLRNNLTDIKYIGRSKKNPKNLKLLSGMVSDYIDGMEGVIKKHADEFKRAFIEYHTNKKSDKRYSWDELIVNQIDIKKAHIIHYDDDDEWPEGSFRKSADKTKKYLDRNNIPYIEWKTSEELSKYIQGHTGKSK